MKDEKESLFLLAYILGNISPKSNIKKVTAPTSIIKRIFPFSIPENIKSLKDAKSNTMAILMVLFATNIVANSFFWLQ